VEEHPSTRFFLKNFIYADFITFDVQNFMLNQNVTFIVAKLFHSDVQVGGAAAADSAVGTSPSTVMPRALRISELEA